MTQASLLFGPPDARILPGSTNIPPQPLSFADFRFNTIGQQPELLKRISAPEPDYHYHDHSSPESSIDHSVQSTPKALSRPTLLEALAAQTDSQDATMTDASNDMVVDTHPIQPSGTLFISNLVSPRGLSHFSTTRLDPARPPIGWSGNTPTPMNPPLSNPEDAAPSGSPSSRPQEAPVSNSPQIHQDISKTSNHISTPPVQPVPVTLDSVSTVTPSPIPANAEPVTTPRSSPSPTHEHDSPYTALRALQSQLFSSLSSLNPPQVDTSHALLLVQAADSHSANALSIAHRVQTLSQQALAAARDAATVAQECLAAAEQAKAHASAAVSAVEHIGNPDFGALKNEWEWKTVIAELRDGLSALGQLLGEREGEEAAHRREMERAEKERKNKESVESAMRMTNGSLPPQIIRAMSVEVAHRTAAAEAHVRSSGTSIQTNSHEAHGSSSIGLRASAELEADAARMAWSLEHRTSPRTNAKPTTSTLLATAEQRETEEVKRRTMIAEHKDQQEAQKQQLQAQEQQKQQEDEAEVRRLQDLKRQKLEVAQFHVKERERQERLQKEEAARRAAEGERLQKEADLLEEQTRKGKEAEARARMEKAQADKQARLKQQERLEKQKFEEAAKEQARLEQQRREAAREQLEQQIAEQAAERRAQEEEAQKAREAKEAANAALTKVYEEAQAVEEQKRREVEELKQKKRAEEVTQARASQLVAEDKRLREEQEKKRQEIMVNKQRATAETAARILADRAQKEKEKNGGVPTTPKSISPPIALSTASAPSASQSPLTHPLPLPVHQSPSTNIGNLTAKKTVAPQTGDASKLRGRAISGGVKLGTDELPQSQPSQPQSPTGPTLPPSPTLARSTAFVREKVPPIPKRSAKTSLQIPAQPVESNIPPAKRLGKTQPPADGRSSSSVKPPSMCRSDMSIGSASDIASSVPVTPGTKSTPLPTAAGDCGTPTPMTPVMPALTISGDREEPPNNNNHHIYEPAPEPVSVHLRGEDRGNLHVIPKSEVSHASPQAQAANLRFVKDEGGVLWNKYLKPDPGVKVKSEPCKEGDELPTVQVKKGSGSTSPVIPLVETAEPESPTMPTPVVPSPIQPTSVTSSSTVHKPNPAALHSSAPKPRPPNTATSNSAGSKTPVSSPTLPTSNALTAPTTLPPKPKLPKFKKTKNLHVDNNQPGPNNSNIPATNKGPNAAHAPLPIRLPRSVPMPFDPRAFGNDPLSLFEDSSAIAPVIQGDGGWDSWVGTPPRLSDRGLAGSTWLDVEPGLDSAPRKSASRRTDHYSPPPSRGPIPPMYPRRPERALPVQDQRSVSGARPAQPRIQSNSGPLLRTPPPPPERLPVLGKRRYREDDNLQRQPIRRQRQSDEREDQVHRPDLARTPPLPERRSTTPERSGGLQSRIGGQREDRTYGGDVYRPTHAPYTAAPARTQPRSYDSYNPTYAPEPSYLDYPPTSIRDSYSNLGRHQVTDTRPDLLDRMDTGSTQSFNPSSYYNRGRPPFATNGSSRGRRGRGGSAGGGRPLEQRLSNSYNNNSLPLAHRLESPPRYH